MVNRPTDEQLEAMAIRIERYDSLNVRKQTAAMLRAMKGRDSLEPAPDARQEGWNAAIEAAADKAYLQADIDARPQALSEAIRAIKKGPRHDT